MVAVFQQLWVHWSMSWDIVWIWATLRMESWRGDLMTWTDSFPFVQTLLPHSVRFFNQYLFSFISRFMAFPVMEFQDQGYKIRKIFA